ncbi:hydroxyethylthiazole kinase [Chitinibacter bivalviorum]|uniref:Hydroxyethylthiazole kinase n=1 Tax=Chitinibacter bivalviorum TaxID=2739434 RepID=A0A7H9BH52_9NEIS|nr:hydroxyethylthiazole kinase [Chitinibacter bivalviorum]QLG87947.1 hydroxyethylthiazole kinase [Chitinibacter bivalviorum]
MTTQISELPFNVLADELERVRANTPLVHVLTNEVVQCFTANTLLAMGASPAMVVAKEEVADFAAIADALLINVGTVYAERLEAMNLAIAAANAAGTPWVLDPVAVGVLPYRTAAAKAMLTQQPAAIRGNGSEIIALAGGLGGGKGVDSTASSTSALEAAIALAQETGAIVAVTGAIDYITDGEQTWSVELGHPLMTKVVGTGCALSAVVAAFLADAPNRLNAVAAACALMALAGERAVECSDGPGTFVAPFLDALAIIHPAQLRQAAL